MLKIKRTSPLTGIERTLEFDVTEEQMRAWQSGVLIQEAMPNLSADEREFIKSGITAEEWEEYFQD